MQSGKRPKHPGCWHRALLCKTVGDKSAGGIDMVQEMLKTCQTRGDKLSAEMRICVLGAVSDLH